MMYAHYSWTHLLIHLLAVNADSHEKLPDYVVANANHIFNAIHSSMRQFGSSWNHNGMSFFHAVVPAGTVLYHGRSFPNPVKGVEWLAFEPEHALMLAHGRCAKTNESRECNIDSPCQPLKKLEEALPSNQYDQMRLGVSDKLSSDSDTVNDDDVNVMGPGYLHTYQTKHALALLYLDGMSAGKSIIGTLDTQEYILLNRTFFNIRPDFGESDRAARICEMIEQKWHSKIDGVIRMEAGFEIILCDFEKHLDTVSVTSSRDVRNQTLPGWDVTWTWYRKIAARYNGIGSNRVRLDYNTFVTAYAYSSAGDLFPEGDGSRPRLNNLNTENLDSIRDAVKNLILNPSTGPDARIDNLNPTDWQAITDMIVARYANDIPYLRSLKDLNILQNTVTLLMRPYIDFSLRDAASEIKRCARYGMPAHLEMINTKGVRGLNSGLSAHHASTAATAVATVNERICRAFFSLLEPLTESQAQSILQNLTNYLDWTTWRDCPYGCRHEQLCFIPIWSRGSYTDRQRGRGICVTQKEFWQLSQGGDIDPQNYWNTEEDFPWPEC